LVVLMLLDLIVLSMTQHRQNWSHITSKSATQFLYISHKFGPTSIFPICVSAAQCSWVAMLYAVDYHIPTTQRKKKRWSVICLLRTVVCLFYASHWDIPNYCAITVLLS
jgi:hypothetical protein